MRHLKFLIEHFPKERIKDNKKRQKRGHGGTYRKSAENKLVSPKNGAFCLNCQKFIRNRYALEYHRKKNQSERKF